MRWRTSIHSAPCESSRRREGGPPRSCAMRRGSAPGSITHKLKSVVPNHKRPSRSAYSPPPLERPSGPCTRVPASKSGSAPRLRKSPAPVSIHQSPSRSWTKRSSPPPGPGRRSTRSPATRTRPERQVLASTSPARDSSTLSTLLSGRPCARVQPTRASSHRRRSPAAFVPIQRLPSRSQKSARTNSSGRPCCTPKDCQPWPCSCSSPRLVPIHSRPRRSVHRQRSSWPGASGRSSGSHSRAPSAPARSS
jgi:hypothetical protein